MRLLLKLLALVVVLALAGVAYMFLAFPQVPPAEAVTIERTPERLARGKYLFDHVALCVDCHSERDWSRFAGPVKPGSEGKGGEAFTSELMVGLPGSLYARNITPAGIGDWTDGEVLRAVTTGVTKHGDPLFPLMPYPNYGRASRDDVEAIVAYTRTLAPIQNAVPDRSLDFPMPLVVRTIPAPAAFAARPAATEGRAYGEYVTRLASCADCHTPRDDQGQPLPGMAFAGGSEFRWPWGGTVRSANLTPDADTGIGAWSEQQFVDKFKAFDTAEMQVLASVEERQQNTVMPWKAYAGMTETDLRAVYQYLRGLTPVTHKVEKHAPAGSR